MDIITLLIAGHFGYHLIAAVGVAYTLIHSDKVHKKSWWKLPLAFLWFLLSIWLIINEIDHSDHDCKPAVSEQHESQS